MTTLPDAPAAERLVRQLLEERLVACGNIVQGMISLYWWEGEIAKQAEVLVLLKTRSESVDQLFGRIAELHPYTTPELVQLPVSGASGEYGRWIMESTRIRA